ncbi:MAG TPA: threonine/serine dehydratase [Jiangellales bacterium]|nr:threonine/serine dehydratase [Jiangellales bacterium]
MVVAPGPAEVRAAAVLIGEHVRHTPVLTVHGAELGVPARVVLKLELLQHTGSFKARGALTTLLGGHLPAGGAVAASGGNHGAAVAWAARELGVPATVFVPATSPADKVDRIRRYGAEVHVVDGYYAEAAVAAAEWAGTRDVLAVHAYDAVPTVAGQGTVGLEVREQVPEASTVLVAVGGGGLSAGVTVACSGGGPAVVPVEAERCPTLHAARRAGAPVDVEVGGVAADSLGARRIGEIPWAVLSAADREVLQVSDEDIAAARGWLWDRCRVLAEPGGATALAALTSGAFRPHPGDTVVVVVCGGNTATLPG